MLQAYAFHYKGKKVDWANNQMKYIKVYVIWIIQIIVFEVVNYLIFIKFAFYC